MVVLDEPRPDAFEEFHRLLFENQPAEGGAGRPTTSSSSTPSQAGADEDAVRGPIVDREFHQWVVNATDQMSKDGVNGTPTVLIDGKAAGVRRRRRARRPCWTRSAEPPSPVGRSRRVAARLRG